MGIYEEKDKIELGSYTGRVITRERVHDYLTSVAYYSSDFKDVGLFSHNSQDLAQAKERHKQELTGLKKLLEKKTKHPK